MKEKLREVLRLFCVDKLLLRLLDKLLSGLSKKRQAIALYFGVSSPDKPTATAK